MLNKDTIKNTIIVTIIFIILIIAMTLTQFFRNIIKYKDIQYYELGKDTIPSINSVVGKRNIYYYNENNKKDIITKVYKYKKIWDTKSDLNNYIDELENNYNYINTSDIDLTKDKGEFELSNNSVDEGNIIIINIKYNKNEYEIKITKGKGKINIYK